MGGNNGGERGEGRQGTCIKHPWTKPKGGRFEGGRQEAMVGENGDNCN